MLKDWITQFRLSWRRDGRGDLKRCEIPPHRFRTLKARQASQKSTMGFQITDGQSVAPRVAARMAVPQSQIADGGRRREMIKPGVYGICHFYWNTSVFRRDQAAYKMKA